MRRKRLLALSLSVVVMVALISACQANPEPPELESPIEQVPTAAETQVSLRSTVVYYQDDSGYLVPVAKRIPWEEGIAKATLACMITNEQNSLEASRLGLNTVLPEGLELDLDVSNELARVSLNSKALEKITNAADENAMVSAIVYTLTEFPTVKQVQILVDGKEKKKLPNGTDIEKPKVRGDINLEGVEGGVSTTGAKKVRLYFESAASGVMVPVTRLVFSNADVETAVLELLKGPRKEGLAGCIPDGTGLISVSQKNGVVTINLSDAFVKAAEAADGGQQTMKALMLTCKQFEGVKEVKIKVDGKDYEMAASTMAMPMYVNDEDEALMNYGNALYDE